MMRICEEKSQDQVLDRVSVVPEGRVECATDAADASPRQDTQTGAATADQPQMSMEEGQAQMDGMVQDRRQITIAYFQIGRTVSASATILLGTDGLTVQMRDAPSDANVWTALEWVMKARPYITADEFIVARIMRPKTKDGSEVRRHSTREEVLLLDVRTLIVRARAYQLEYFVDDLNRPQSLLSADQFSPEPRDLQFDLQIHRKCFAVREARRVNYQVGRIASQNDKPRLDEITKSVAIKDASGYERIGVRDALTCRSDAFEPDRCLAPAGHDADAMSQDQVLYVGRMCVLKASFPVYLGGGRDVKPELSPGELRIDRLGQGSLHATAPTTEGRTADTSAWTRSGASSLIPPKTMAELMNELPDFRDEEGGGVEGTRRRGRQRAH